MYWNKRIQALSPYIPGEQPQDRKFIKLNTNENPYPPSPRVIEAIQKAAGDSLRLYPDPACRALRETIACQYRVRPEQVFVGNGSDEVLAFAFAAFFDGQEPVLFPDITYSFYPVYAGLWDIPFCTIPLREDFSITAADYQKPCGGVIFPNPNAPTGQALSLREILSILEYQKNAGKVMILDEAYIAFADAASAVSSIQDYPNLLTVHTLSKAASLAGLRVGFAIGGEELIEGLCRVRDSFNSYTLDRLALAGAAAALLDAAYYDAINQRIIATRNRIAASLIALGFTVIPSSANFIFIRAPAKSGAEFFAALRDQGVLVRHFRKPRIEHFLRVSIGTDDEMDLFLEICRKLI